MSVNIRNMVKPLPLLDPAQTAACWPPLSAQPLSAGQAGQVAPLLKALADPVRLRLVSLVASPAGGEMCVCDLSDIVNLSQPTISHHLKVLHDAGLAEREKRGVWVYYRAHGIAGQPGHADRLIMLARRSFLAGDQPSAADRYGAPMAMTRTPRSRRIATSGSRDWSRAPR